MSDFFETGAEGTENSLVIALDSHNVNNDDTNNSNITNITRNGSSTSISICGSPDHGSPDLGVQSVAFCSPDQVYSTFLLFSGSIPFVAVNISNIREK